jgi:hypothetical protein
MKLLRIFLPLRRHFGEQMTKETKLSIHNITVKAALKFGSEAWVLRKREEQRLEVVINICVGHIVCVWVGV